MAKNDETDGIDRKGMRDETIKTMIVMLKTAGAIESKEPSSKLLKNQVKEIVATYENGFKNDSSEKQKENLYNLIKKELTNTNIMVDKINDGSNQPIKNIVDQASLAFQKSREFDFAGADNHLEKIVNIIDTHQISKSQNKEIESTSVKKNIRNQLGSAISKIEKIRDDIVKDLKDNKKLLKVFNDTISPILSEMYKFQDKINEQKENLVKEKDKTITSVREPVNPIAAKAKQTKKYISEFSNNTMNKLEKLVEEKINKDSEKIEDMGKKLISNIHKLSSQLLKFKESLSKEFTKKETSFNNLKDKIEENLLKLETNLDNFKKKTIPPAIEKLQDISGTIIDKIYNKMPDTLTDAHFNVEQVVRDKKVMITLKNKITGNSVAIGLDKILKIVSNANKTKKQNNNDINSSQDKKSNSVRSFP
ncbi:MAG: hypothetical protein EKK61_01225 [Rickettsiales bacterium]|nr:MAG: hypothetical protein EKK61_01225 [Rickettsiales bacterium]